MQNSQKEQRVVALVLRHTALKENDYIATLLSPDEGMISLVVRGISRRRYPLLCLIEPFTIGEFLFVRGKKELHRFLDGSLIDPQLFLRKELSSLQAAGQLCNDLLDSQLPGKPSHYLYALLTTYLKQLPLFPDKTPLTCSFRLKLLFHEGMLCMEGGALHYAGGESLSIDTETQQWITVLTHQRSFATLRELIPPEPVTLLISNLFHAIYDKHPAKV